MRSMIFSEFHLNIADGFGFSVKMIFFLISQTLLVNVIYRIIYVVFGKNLQGI